MTENEMSYEVFSLIDVLKSVGLKDIMYFPEKGCHLGTNRSDNET